MTAWIRLLVAAVALSAFMSLPACDQSADEELEDAAEDVEDAQEEMADDLDDLGE